MKNLGGVGANLGDRVVSPSQKLGLTGIFLCEYIMVPKDSIYNFKSPLPIFLAILSKY